MLLNYKLSTNITKQSFHKLIDSSVLKRSLKRSFEDIFNQRTKLEKYNLSSLVSPFFGKKTILINFEEVCLLDHFIIIAIQSTIAKDL